MNETELRKALERHEFEVYYQPRVSLPTGEIVGAEALLRWRSPQRGLVLPMSFIPMAEEAGLLAQIEDRVMREAFAQARVWRAARAGVAPLTISVNLSADRFRHPELVETISSLLHESGIDAPGVQLEITHSRLLPSSPTTGETLRGLRALGVEITMDNFGTGYSSLGYLHRFPIDYLSIDKSFIAKLGSDNGATSIVEAMVSLAHNLGLRAIAEGVENDGQLRVLRETGCEFAQGYYFSEPVPRNEMSEMLR